MIGRAAMKATAPVLALFVALVLSLAGKASAVEEPADIQADVAAGKLPPLAERLPQEPRIVDMAALGKTEGRYGGSLRMIMADAKDTRFMTVYSYARLVVFDQNLNLVPDILKSFDVEQGRIFTFHLRKGHKWSDGQPFTTEDFRYFWEDIALNPDFARTGLPEAMLVDGKPPKFEIIDPLTVRYSWEKPNPNFLPALAGASPLFIYMPAHYLKQFHPKYADPAKLAALIKAAKAKDWMSLHTAKARQYRQENPDLPTLDPWVNTTAPPSERFIFKRNPYFHRIDKGGRQLPYIGTVYLSMSSEDIIPAKTGSGESDLQGRYLRFENYTFLKQAEKQHPITVDLWRNGFGSQVAFLPNLNVKDPVWRKLMQDMRFRRALSLAINRHEINQQFYFGLAHESANSVLDTSPLYRKEFAQAWAQYDPDAANKLLDEIGLKRGDDGIRILPDGRPAELIVEMNNDNERADMMELMVDYWSAIGIKVFPRTVNLDVLRRRLLSGDTMMAVWSGLNVGDATADLSPQELAPTNGAQATWPLWGEYVEKHGKAGEPVTLPAAKQLLDLYNAWRISASTEERRRIWTQMLSIFTDQVFTIGTVNDVLQPIVARRTLRNLPAKGVWAFDPSAYFGIYMMDTFWYDEESGTR